MKKHYQVQFGDYQMELRGGEVLYRKKNSIRSCCCLIMLLSVLKC